MFIGQKIITIDRDKIKNPKKKFYGRRYFINGKFITLTRCRVCGREFQYEGLKAPVHCGKDGCVEYWRRFMQHQFMAVNGMVGDKEFFKRNVVIKELLNTSKNVREVEDNMRRTQIIPEQMIKRKVDRRRMVFASFQIKGKKLGEI